MHIEVESYSDPVTPGEQPAAITAVYSLIEGFRYVRYAEHFGVNSDAAPRLTWGPKRKLRLALGMVEPDHWNRRTAFLYFTSSRT